MPEKKLLFTFDYELFLGKKSGSVEQCLIRPTEKILAILNHYHSKGIFFVDTTYLLRLKEISINQPPALDDLEKIIAQIQNLIRTGHYVFPHIHPHWLDAVYLPEQNQWDLSDSHRYRFHSLSNALRISIFEDSIQILKEIITSVSSSYSFDSYRAGGWCIQPFEDFKPIFRQNGIKNDFSILPRKNNFMEEQYYDFLNAPEKKIYHFENEVLTEEAAGTFTEYTISTLTIPTLYSLLNRIWLKYLWKTNNRSMGNGQSLKTSFSDSHSSSGMNYEMASLESLNTVTFPLYINYLKQHNYLHFISHPKMLSPHNILVFERFCKKISKEKTETDFRKFLS